MHLSRSFALGAFLAVPCLVVSSLVAQNGAGLRVVAQGGVLSVDVATADATVEVSVIGSGTTTSHTVSPDRTTSIPIADLPSGSLVVVSVGTGRRRRFVVVEVTAP